MTKNILIIDDSALMRRLVSDIINSDSRFQVVDQAKDGQEAFDLLVKNPNKYDAVVSDLRMPNMDGLELLSVIQKYRIKCKVIVVSTLVKDGAKETIIALERGAFDFILKPSNSSAAAIGEFKEKFIRALEAATRVQHLDQTEQKEQPARAVVQPVNRVRKQLKAEKKLVAIASSTGGPKALKDVIPMLPKNLDAPVVLVQHMPAGFTASLAQRMDELSEIRVKEAEHGEILKKGWVYIAPGGNHFRIEPVAGGEHKVVLSQEEPIGGLRPCANTMYESLAKSTFDEITCVVLTGMGMDGTAGIQSLKKSKDLYVVAQDEASCIVYGMPKAIANAGLTDKVVTLTGVSDEIIKNVGVLSNGR